jgi:glutamate racemase
LDTRPIGVFDSGLGGLTAVKELQRLLPGEDIVYFGDTGRVPYGTRNRETIEKFAMQDIRFLQTFDVKAIIIACGTVSSVAFDKVAATLTIPIIGVVEPAAGAAVNATENGFIGVLGTSAAIGSGAYEKVIHSISPKARIKSRACPLFVPLVENGYFLRGNKIAELAAHEYLDEFKGCGVDTLILGCTHYPLLRGVIEDILPDVKIIDAGSETAKAAIPILEQNGLLSDRGGNTRFFVSDCTDDFERLAGIFLEHPVMGHVEKVEIEKY